MKRSLILLVAAVLLVGCGKEKQVGSSQTVTPIMPTSSAIEAPSVTPTLPALLIASSTPVPSGTGEQPLTPTPMAERVREGSFVKRTSYRALDESKVCTEITRFLDAAQQTGEENDELAAEFFAKGIFMDYLAMDFYDYSDGPREGAYPHSIVFSQSFADSIFYGLNIGVDSERVTEVLGEPDDGGSYSSIYYYEDCSVLFFGRETVEFIGIVKMPVLEDSYGDMLVDIIRIGKEGRFVEIYEEMMERYPLVQVNNNATGMFISYPNGVAISQYQDITISPSYYGYFEEIDAAGSDMDVYFSPFDADRACFQDFCYVMKADEWVISPDGSKRAFLVSNGIYTSHLYIDVNAPKVLDLQGGIHNFVWLDDDRLLADSYLEGVILINANTGEYEAAGEEYRNFFHE